MRNVGDQDKVSDQDIPETYVQVSCIYKDAVGCVFSVTKPKSCSSLVHETLVQISSSISPNNKDSSE